jgi:hypothetical protein
MIFSTVGQTAMLMAFILEMFGSNPSGDNDRFDVWCYSFVSGNIPGL